VWWCGGVVVWWCGGVVVWWCGGVVVWWCGGVVVWWCGGVVSVERAQRVWARGGGEGQADVAWIPAFAYVMANARYGAEARLQVVRSVDRYAVVVTRNGPGEPDRLEDLVDRRVAFPSSVRGRLRAMVVAA
jgi:hypothetical protein